MSSFASSSDVGEDIMVSSSLDSVSEWKGKVNKSEIPRDQLEFSRPCDNLEYCPIGAELSSLNCRECAWKYGCIFTTCRMALHTLESLLFNGYGNPCT
ncbi:unnamed protein product [Acanthoscelides obtectus]|uniref:Uncharacterized protein n=1 Tax=Acanthoscelides obtectus TaxID=200917 RepID=A0A9P0PGK5_ACAOB|nr:unnamed protein product [Acanthoscelides obtectus]CAK1647499.1 hypothetical protein AOBTE_LOCUS15236 [Acanthoscelides obtectus]